MLQTIVVLVVILIMFILGGWMTFFGHRAFRFCGTLFGFALGVGGVLFGAGQLGFAFDTMPILIATPLAGLCLGLLGAFVPIVGAGLGGVCVGYFYGTGVVYSADVLLGGAVAPILYTGISVLLIVTVFILCLVFREAAKWLTTALCGSYVASLALTLGLMWFLAGGFNSTDPALSGSFILQIIAIYGMISSTTKMFLLLFALLFGVLGCILQAQSTKKQAKEPAFLDFSSGAEDAIPLDDFDDEVPLLEEDNPRKRKRKKRKRDLDLDLEEDSDVLDIFAAKKARLGANAAGDIPEDIPGATLVSTSRVDAIQQTPASDETDNPSMEKTQVFNRIKQPDAPSVNEAPVAQQKSKASAKRQKAPDPQLPRASAGQNTPSVAPYDSTDVATRKTQRPSAPSKFAPRAQRRKGK